MGLSSEVLVDAWRQAEAAGHGKKQDILKAAAKRLGVSLSTLYRELETAGLKKPRQQRSDAGDFVLSRIEAQVLSAFLMQAYRANNKKLCSIANALEVLRKNGELIAGRVDDTTGEITYLSENACSRALRHYGLHPEQLRRPSASIRQRSLHPNDVWQIDASISTLFYVPESGLADMAPGEFYKNKPGNFEKIKRQRLTRYVVTDHTSGAVFCWYVAGGESIANLGESLLEAMRDKPGESLYGVPFHLYYDPGSAATKTFKRFLSALGVIPVVHSVGNARATGQVEVTHNLIETQFEVGFKYTTVPGIDWINTKARQFCRWFNAKRVHSRHGKTRLAKWMEIAQEQLRIVDIDLARELLNREPVPAKVYDDIRIQFKGQRYDVSGVPGVCIGEKLPVTINPLIPGHAWVVLYEDGHEVLFPIEPVVLDDHGFEIDSPIIGREVKAPADTVLDTNRKAIQRLIYEVDTDEAAQQAAKARKVPFGGRIDPYKHLDDLPDVSVLPRRGTAHLINKDQRIVEQLLTHAEAALRLKPRLHWTAKHYTALTQRYPEGVPESALDELLAEWSHTPVQQGGNR
ncbi:hypothetical protein [Gynuella sp.]|uniref:hypothetical protein n=1 Tax=Gynuella sp. TaxID=2969146 RepID=UPI003D0A80E7